VTLLQKINRVRVRRSRLFLLAWLLTGVVAHADDLPFVTVTANRRPESNQKVPVDIMTISAEDAEEVGVTDAQSLAAVVPGFLFNRQSNASTPFLRGVGNPVGQSGDEPSVALYVDDVYVPAGSASMARFTSIDRIEVEKGPQGTLFGRNATGGVVQLFTRNPTDKPELRVTAGYANYDTWSADMYATGTLTKQLLANVSAYWSDQSKGWGRNVTTGTPTFRSRLQSKREFRLRRRCPSVRREREDHARLQPVATREHQRLPRHAQ
jgi:iron complex outermembrane receptor protein